MYEVTVGRRGVVLSLCAGARLVLILCAVVVLNEVLIANQLQKCIR